MYFPSASVGAVAKTWPFHHSSTVHPSSPISPANGSRRPSPLRSSNTMPFAKFTPVGGLSGGGGGGGGGGGTGAGGGGGGGGTGAGGGGGGGGGGKGGGGGGGGGGTAAGGGGGGGGTGAGAGHLLAWAAATAAAPR